MKNPLSIVRRIWNRFRCPGPACPFPVLFERFQSILARNNEILEIMAEMGEKLSGDYVFDRQYIVNVCERLSDLVYHLIHDLNVLSGQKYLNLYAALDRIQNRLEAVLAGQPSYGEIPYTLPYDDLNRDWCDEVGSKNANLGEVLSVLELPIPMGFAITTRVYHEFVTHRGLDEKITALLETAADQNGDRLNEVLQRIRELIEEAPVPDAASSEIRSRIEQLGQRLQRDRLFFALRSSAPGEDTEHSFAGLHWSILNVPEEEVEETYKKVISSIYSVEAWRYRQEKGFKSHETAMAVGCQLMVDAVCSGVLYTVDPANPQDETLTVAASWGLGIPVVEGSRKVDRFRLNRDPPHTLKEMHVVRKDRMLVAREEGGLRWITVPGEKQDKACLNSKQLEELAQVGMLLERYFKRPQDVEWAFDSTGRLVVLQTRPLNIRSLLDENVCRISDVTASAPVVWSGRGDVVQRGVAVGTVYVVRTDEDLKNVPADVILVTRESSPRLAQVIRKVRGILTDVGSPMGHMATVAREFRVPTVVNTGIATQVLKTGDEITLDATENVVYKGRIRELCYYELTQEPVFEESYEYRLLRRLLRSITPLNLVDPHDRNFSPESCRTLHDITRFVHEKAVAELAMLNTEKWAKYGPKPKRLKMSVPLDLQVIDVDGGLQSPEDAREVDVDQVASVPMAAFLSGLLESEMWSTEPVSMDFGSFMSSMSRTFDSSMSSPDAIGRNLVVLSREYMNLNLRIGYHFNIIDSYVGERINDNYAYFRFLGGVTDLIRRSRRARFIGEVLDRWGFRVEIRGDLVIGRIKKRSQPDMERALRLLGALVAYTRQLDVQLVSDEEVIRHLEQFERSVASLLSGPEQDRPKGG